MGTILIITLLFGINDIDAIINPTISGVSAIEIFAHLIGQFGTTCILVIFIGTFFFCGQGVMKACSQIGQELAVSGAFPKSAYLSQLTPQGQPARMRWLCSCISCGIGVLYLFNTTALQALTSAVAIELKEAYHLLVYAIPIALRIFYPNPTLFQPGPFSLGTLRGPNSVIAILWAVLGVFVFTLPGIYPITLENMNYAGVLLLSSLVMILGYWYFSARYWFDLDREREGPASKSLSPYLSEKQEGAKSTRSAGSGIGAGVGGEGAAEEGLCGMSRPSALEARAAVVSEEEIDLAGCDDKDLDEIEHWLEHLERDLRSLE
ncbi:hypothetical protein BGX23_006059 [Mortierella sp. AD031]|nr:hypothetical protein BGX23_006059 [Mortierella sp. AD031]